MYIGIGIKVNVSFCLSKWMKLGKNKFISVGIRKVSAYLLTLNCTEKKIFRKYPEFSNSLVVGVLTVCKVRA